jgi:hypothetical protein
MKKPTGLEPMLRKATIKAIDGIGKKAAKSESAAADVVGKLLSRWNKMSTAEKEEVMAIVIATATTAVTAIAGIKARRSKKRGLKRVAKAIVKRV